MYASAVEPDRTLSREDVLMLMGSLPERVGDLVATLDEELILYRHGPAFPTLKELVAHLAAAATALDGLLREAGLEGRLEADVGATIDPSSDPSLEPDPRPSGEDLMRAYARVRRRTMDLVRGWEGEKWELRLQDPRREETSLLDLCRLATAHELGHLTQLRNLIALLPEPQDLGPVAASPAPPPAPPA